MGSLALSAIVFGRPASAQSRERDIALFERQPIGIVVLHPKHASEIDRAEIASFAKDAIERHSEDLDKGEFVLWVQFLQSAAAKALAQLTGVQTFPPGEVARELHAALNVSEFADGKLLDAAGRALSTTRFSPTERQ